MHTGRYSIQNFCFHLVEDHCHRERDEAVDKKARKKLIIACILCVVFMIAEIVGKLINILSFNRTILNPYTFFFLSYNVWRSSCTGGVMSNSLAIATDAAHLLTDFASFLISLFSIWVSGRPATRKMPFGWYRAEASTI